MTLCQLLDQITSGSGGLEATDIVSLIKQMMDFWNSDHRISEYINKMEDSQKKSIRAGLPITDD